LESKKNKKEHEYILKVKLGYSWLTAKTGVGIRKSSVERSVSTKTE
jgi:hypothetical protein